jgi:hypothetical protein
MYVSSSPKNGNLPKPRVTLKLPFKVPKWTIKVSKWTKILLNSSVFVFKKKKLIKNKIYTIK